ncbi:MAG: HD domain-containing phosphohydrolase, partial [Acidobacteriota bacterium]
MSEGEGKRQRYSIFFVLALLLVVLVVVPLVSYAWKAITTSKGYIEESLRERQAKTAIPAATHIQTLMGEYVQHLANLSNSFEIYSNEADFRNDYEALLQRHILDRSITRDTLLLQYFDDQGNQLSAPGRGVQADEQAALDSMIVPVARQAIQTDKLQNSGVFQVRLQVYGKMSLPAIALSIPLHAGNKPVAAVSGIFLLQSIQDALAQYSREFTLFVTDDKGNLIFHSNPALQGRSVNMSTNPMVQRVVSAGVYPTSTINYNVTEMGKKRTRTYLVTCSPIPDYHWLLFSYVDRNKFFAPIVQLRKQSIYWVSLSILVALIIGLVLARLITRPLSDLTEVSGALAQGDFDKRADVRSRNEIGVLARSFNTMADEIQDYVKRLEAAAAENKQLFMSSIRAIANAIDAKDPYTRGHSERVSTYTLIIARRYGLDEDRLREMEISSLLHDVGKIGVEDRILRKPGALTDAEFEIMKTHTTKGADILRSIPQMAPMIPGVKHHHERWSGGGYPEGLKGEEIPLIARIIFVADSFDDMTTNRPYQRAMSFDQEASRINELVVKV